MRGARTSRSFCRLSGLALAALVVLGMFGCVATAAAAPPTLTGLSPNAGPSAGGNTVTITGTGFVPGAAVTFGGTPGSAPVFVSATELTVTAPPHAAGPARVVVTTPDGNSGSPPAATYTYGVPVVTSVSPGAGGTGGGETVTIIGKSFPTDATVHFGSNAGINLVWVSPTKLTATAPPGAEGTVHVTVTSAAGTSASTKASLYSYGIPAVSGVSPNAGPPAGGNTVKITGARFTPAATVTFGSTAASSVTFVGADQLKAVVPAGAEGTTDVVVGTTAGTSAVSSASKYTYGFAPTITGVSPSAGPTGGGNTVTITGTAFVPGTTVTFGSTPGFAPVLLSSTELTVTAPPHAAGAVRVTVTTPAGSARTSTAMNYTYGTPSVTGLSPTSGAAGGGETVTITGKHFTTDATVNFGSTPASNLVWVSPSKLTVTAPPGTGTQHVTVTTPAGTSPATAANVYTYGAAG